MKNCINIKGVLISFVVSFVILGVWYLYEYHQFGELQWDRTCDEVVFWLYLLAMSISFSLAFPSAKTAEFVGYIVWDNNSEAEWRCPVCGQGVAEEYECCPYCTARLRFPEPPPLEDVEYLQIKKVDEGKLTIQESDEKILFKCPTCDKVMSVMWKDEAGTWIVDRSRYCSKCGTKLNWRLREEMSNRNV